MNISKKDAALSGQKGFTLLELLIVITIIAILSVILIIAINPAETLRKARDTQRLSDLSSLKTAISIYTTTKTSPDLDATTAICLVSAGSAAQISYSSPAAADVDCTASVDEGSDADGTFAADACFNVTEANVGLVDGLGWVPVDLTSITGGSPISNMPLDPVNTTMLVTPTNTTLTYRYACQDGTGTPGNVFELNAILESEAFGPLSADDNKSAKDGGDNAAYYEVGTNLRLMGETGTNY